MGNACYKPDEDKVELDLRDFHLDVVVGKGAFGKVKKVRHIASKKDYALKYIDKDLAVKKKAVMNIFEERRLLEQLNHPFIINLRYAFQDDQNMFFVLDLAEGGDLRYHMLRVPEIPDDTLQCYMAEISLALEYLHSEKVIHRDIKPDNLIIDDKGHVHLCDFNVSYRCDKAPPTRKAGTMVYMAPEMFTQTPYEYSVDYFATGVVLYECIYKCRPFLGRNEDELVANITNNPVPFPDCAIVIKKRDKTPRIRPLSEDLKSFLRGLMAKKPEDRLGYQAEGLKKLREHPWMSHIDWDAARRKELKPSFAPNPKERNFDGIHYLEEVFVDDNQLHYKPRKKGVGPSKSDIGSLDLSPDKLPTEPEKQLEYINQFFKPFNWKTKTGILDSVLPSRDENMNPPQVDTNLEDRRQASDQHQ